MRYFLLISIVFGYIAFVSSEACVQCNSSTDVKCAINPEQILAKDCANSSSICYTRILDGMTIRGCASDLPNETASKCTNEMECLVCIASGCNKHIFPQHRAQCLQCEGHASSECATGSFAKPTYCPIYKMGDKCYIRKTNTNDTQSFTRGCLSSAQEKSLCLKLDDCFTCEGVGCNFIPSDSKDIPTANDSGIWSFSTILIVTCLAFVLN